MNNDFKMTELRSVDWMNDGMGNSRTPSGVRVTEANAVACTAYLACVRVISESVASLPLFLYERLEAGGKRKATSVPLNRILHQQPNPWQTAMEFREQMTALYLIYGQSFAEIKPGINGAVQELWPLHPSRMTVSRLENGTLRYAYKEPNGMQTVYAQNQMLHLRWLSTDGINGLQPVSLCRNAIGLAQALEQHGSTYFGNGARPGIVLESENPIPVEAAERLREQWERMHRGSDRAFRTAVMPNGVKVKELSGSNESAQFLETRRFQIEEIARAFRIPQHLIGELTKSSFNNIEVQSNEFVVYCLLPHLRRWEAAISRDLIADDEIYFAEHSVTGLLRGDSQSRANYYREMANLGVLSINEIRELENLNPIGPEGDQRFMQMNMTTLANIVTQPATPAAPAAPRSVRSVEARAMTISIDFDETFAKDPTMWGEFAMKSAADGNTVYMITRREDTPENQAEIEETIGQYADAFTDVLLIGAAMQKADGAKAAGIAVDVWIDDSPETIQGENQNGN